MIKKRHISEVFATKEDAEELITKINDEVNEKYRRSKLHIYLHSNESVVGWKEKKYVRNSSK